MSEQDTTTLPLFCQPKSTGGLWIPDAILKHPDLSPTAKILAAQICAYGERGCFRSNDSLAVMIGVSSKTVSREVSDMIKRGIIRVNGNTSDRVLTLDNLSIDEIPDSGQFDPSKGPTLDNLSRNSGQFVHHNIKGEQSNSKKSVRKSSQVIPPTLDMVRNRIKATSSPVNPEKFFSHYQSNGWKVGKNKMKDWHAAIRYWESTDGKSRNTSPKAHRTDFGKIESALGRTIEV